MRQVSLRLRIYIGLMVVLGLGMLALTLEGQSPPPVTARVIGLTVGLAGLIGLAGAYPFPLSPKVKANVVTAPLFAAILILPPAAATVAAIVGIGGSGVVLKRKWHNTAFNSAAAAVYAGGAALALAAISRGQTFFTWPWGVAGVVTAAAIVFTVNRAAVSGAAFLEAGKSPLWILRREWRRDVVQEVALLSLGCAAALAASLAPWSFIFLLAPGVVVYRAFARVTALSAALETQMAQLRAAEAQLVQSAKMASLGTMAAGIGHQINNPVFVVRGRAELLLEGADRHLRSEKARQHIEVIRDMADRVARIVKCLLTSSRPSEDGRACTDANEALESMVTLLETKLTRANVEVVRNYEELLPLVPGESIEIQEMLGNLMSNACDAMPVGGKLTLTTRSVDSTVVIEVTDIGTGIPEANLSKLFDPFFTTKETSGGMGLGLYVVKNIAQKHGGTVTVHSKQGQGTTFRITLPAVDSARKPAPVERLSELVKLR